MRSGDGYYRTRRARRDAIRQPTIAHATSPTARDEPYRTRAGPRPYGTRRPSRPQRWDGGPVVRRPGVLILFSYARLCPVIPAYALLCSLMSRLPGLSGCGSVRHGVSGCERPNAGLHLRRWQFYRSARLAARDELYKMRRVSGRASGVRCKPCWAAG